MRPVVRVFSSIFAFVLIGGFLLISDRAASASTTSDAALRWTVTIDGRNVQGADANRPLQLHPDSGARVRIQVENGGTRSIEIRRFRMRGQVMGLTFFTYATDLNIILPTKTHTTRMFEIDLDDLSGQANGLIPSQVQLLGPSRQTIAERDFTADVRGSVFSVYGVFGLAVAAITALLIAGLLIALFGRRRLPTNRWRRAVRFLPVGIGVGFTLTFSLSATRQLVPNAGLWVSLVAGCGAAAFLIGYFTPNGNVDEANEAGEADAAEVHVPQQARRDITTRWHSRRHRAGEPMRESSSANDELP